MNRSYSKIRHIQESNLKLERRVLTESEYVIYGNAGHLGGKGMFIYTGNGGYSMIPNTLEFKRNMEEFPHIFNNRKECDKTIKVLRKERPDIQWYIKSL